MTQKEYFYKKLIINANIAHPIYKIINNCINQNCEL